MSKRIKDLLVKDLQSRLGETSEMLVVDSSRLDAISDNRFRLALGEKDIRVLTVKNSMAIRALHANGVTSLDQVLEGPSSLVYGGEDIVSLSKELAAWLREFGETFEIKGGTVEGTSLSSEDVIDLSKMPSREELIGQIAGRLLSPGARIAGALLGPGGKLAGQLKTVAERDEDESEASTEEVAAEDAEGEAGAAAEESATTEEAEAGEAEAGEAEAGEAEAGEAEAGEAEEEETEETDA